MEPCADHFWTRAGGRHSRGLNRIHTDPVRSGRSVISSHRDLSDDDSVDCVGADSLASAPRRTPDHGNSLMGVGCRLRRVPCTAFCNMGNVVGIYHCGELCCVGCNITVVGSDSRVDSPARTFDSPGDLWTCFGHKRRHCHWLERHRSESWYCSIARKRLGSDGSVDDRWLLVDR